MSLTTQEKLDSIRRDIDRKYLFEIVGSWRLQSLVYRWTRDGIKWGIHFVTDFPRHTVLVYDERDPEKIE